jgi:hypothetical protein
MLDQGAPDRKIPCDHLGWLLAAITVAVIVGPFLLPRPMPSRAPLSFAAFLTSFGPISTDVPSLSSVSGTHIHARRLCGAL